MKLLIAAALAGATLPAVPAVSDPRPAAPAAECAPPQARLRAGARHERDPNALTPAEAAAAERDVARMLGGRRVPTATARIRTVHVPVYFHVIHDGRAGNVPAARIRRQISVLNGAYGGRAGGYDTRFVFRLRAITRSDDATWYEDPEGNESAFKRRLRRGGPGTLNLYSADLGGEMLGWSTFPWRYRDGPRLDGVVLHADSLPGGPIPRYDRGHTATHEIGHWFGLYHTFQNGCESPGDRVADTPPEREPADGCPAGKDTCPSRGSDPVHNYMNYSRDACMTRFTWGQAARMHKIWTAYRDR